MEVLVRKGMRVSRFNKRIIVSILGLGVLLVPGLASASSSPTLNQTINNGSLTTNIYQSGDTTPVASPTVSFSPVNVSFQCQTTTATLGDTNDLVNVTNLDTSTGHAGWTLTLAATGGAAATWTNGTNTYSYDTTTGSGCTSGQMTVNPSVATITDDCNSVCTNTGVSLGASTALNSSGTYSATLLTDGNYSTWEGYLKGISLSQAIPAQQASGSYSLPMTITVAAQ